MPGQVQELQVSGTPEGGTLARVLARTLPYTGQYFSTVCLEIKKSFVLDSARTWLKIWNRVDRGRFCIQGQKGNEIGRVVPKLSTISW